MDNVIKPKTEEPIAENTQGELSPELLDAGINLKNLETLNYLGLKSEMFNEDVMEKVEKIGEFISDIKDLKEMDINLGNPNNISRLDKVYSYVLLIEQEQEIKRKQDLILKEKTKWQAPAQLSRT